MGFSNLDLGYLDDIAVGKISLRCVVSGCEEKEYLICAKHLEKFGLEILEEARLRLISIRNYKNRNMRYKISYAIVREIKKRIQAGDEFEKIREDLKSLCNKKEVLEEYYTCLTSYLAS